MSNQYSLRDMISRDLRAYADKIVNNGLGGWDNYAEILKTLDIMSIRTILINSYVIVRDEHGGNHLLRRALLELLYKVSIMKSVVAGQ